MGKSREIKPRYRCCVYDLEAEQLFRNLKLQTIKSYGDSVTLEDGTVLHKEEQDPDLYTEINEDIHEICDMPLAIDGYFTDQEMNYRFMYLDDDNIVMVAKCLKGVGINLQAVFDDETNRKAGGFLRND